MDKHYSKSKIRLYYQINYHIHWLDSIQFVPNLYLHAIQKTKENDLSFLQILKN